MENDIETIEAQINDDKKNEKDEERTKEQDQLKRNGEDLQVRQKIHGLKFSAKLMFYIIHFFFVLSIPSLNIQNNKPAWLTT